MLVIECDDFCEEYNSLNLFKELHKINPAFKATIYAIPGLCPEELLKQIPPWIEVAVHGWMHSPGIKLNSGTPECLNWTTPQIMELLSRPILKYFTKGFKAPWYRISNECYKRLLQNGYWVSDISINRCRLPNGLRFYIQAEDPDSFYMHLGVHNPDSILKIYGTLIEKISKETEFQFVSERLEER